MMHNGQRLVYHAVPAILPPGEKSGDYEEEEEGEEEREGKWEERLREYMRNCRVNVTIRQVNP